MIFDAVKNADQYKGISTRLDRALEVLKITDFAALEPGSYKVDEEIFYNVMTPEVRPWEETKWEHHRKYIDIQHVVVEGEQIGVCPLTDVDNWGEFNEEGDYAFAEGDAAEALRLPMNPDKFAVFFPSDAHRPTVAAGEVKQVKKVCIKVLV